MPLDPIIARGVAPIDVSNSLYQIAQLGIADREERRRARTNDLLERRYEGQQKEAAGLQQKQQALAKVEWALASPSPAKAILDDPEAVEAFTRAGMDLVGIDDDKARQLLMQARGAMASELGQGPPPAEKPDYKIVGDEVVKFGPEGVKPVYQGKRSYAPPAPVRPQWEQIEDENGQRWVYDANSADPRSTLRPLATPGGKQIGSRASSAQPRIIPDPYGGDPSLVEQGADGSYVRKPIPLAGQPAGQAPIVKVKTREEAMALPSGTLFETPDGRVKVRP